MTRVFGTRSKNNLSQVSPTLVRICERALEISETDFTVICGHRDKAGQDAAWRAGTTKVRFPNSAHNQLPACAVDIIPYPFKGWGDTKGFEQISLAMFKAASEFGVAIRWGGDFNRDGNKTTSDGWDKPHFELHPWRAYA